MKPVIIGLDIGGTNIKSILIDMAAPAILDKKQISTQASNGIATVIDNIIRLINGNIAAASRLGCPVSVVGIGSAGLVENGMVRNSPNLPGWQESVPLHKLVKARLKSINLPIIVENDVNCFIMAEYTMGAAKGCSNAVGLAIGTGVGGGIIINGELVTGAHGGAGELGHMTVEIDGPLCKCGNSGCLEAMIGTDAIVERYRSLNSKACPEHGDSAKPANGFKIQKPVLSTANLPNVRMDSKFTVAEISVRAKRGEVAAVRTFTETGKILGVALANIANIFNPQVIVLGGGVAQAGRFLIEPAKKEMMKRAMPYNVKGLKIKMAKLGPVAGAVGAAILAYRYSAK